MRTEFSIGALCLCVAASVSVAITIYCSLRPPLKPNEALSAEVVHVQAVQSARETQKQIERLSKELARTSAAIEEVGRNLEQHNDLCCSDGQQASPAADSAP
jgi:hypothetical protein